MNVVGYLRVSTDRQAEEGLGLEVQEAAIREWAEANGHHVVKVFRDEGISGSNGIETRVGLAEALELLGNGAGGLVVYRLDRLARDLVLQEQLLAECWRSDAQVFSTSKAEADYLENDPSDPSRALIRQVLGAVGQYERAMIRLRLEAGRKRKGAKGGYAYGGPPFGFMAANGELVPEPSEQATLARIGELRSQGLTLREVGARLDTEGLRPRRGGCWNSGILSKIVRRSDFKPRDHYVSSC
jgi:DNA invertase Pin-like site-specific DNA recombinase